VRTVGIAVGELGAEVLDLLLELEDLRLGVVCTVLGRAIDGGRRRAALDRAALSRLTWAGG